MNCMSYACYTQSKDPPWTKKISAMPVHSAMGHDLCSISLTCCAVTIDKSQFRHTFITCKRLQKEHVIGLYKQQLHH